jgi:hypothetical protein
MNHRTLCNVVIFALAFAVGYDIEGNLTRTSSSTRTGILVEVLALEGCSSCPSADGVLAQLAEQQLVDVADVIAMSEHLDYWNQLGWSEPFSAPQFAARQNQYPRAFRHAEVNTPQMVVDGQAEWDQSVLLIGIAYSVDGSRY